MQHPLGAQDQSTCESVYDALCASRLQLDLLVTFVIHPPFIDQADLRAPLEDIPGMGFLNTHKGPGQLDKSTIQHGMELRTP